MDSELSRSRAKEIESLYIPRSMPDAAEPRSEQDYRLDNGDGFSVAVSHFVLKAVRFCPLSEPW